MWEKEMATYSSVLAWRIPGTGEPRGLLSMGLHRVWNDWSDLAAAAAAAFFFTELASRIQCSWCGSLSESLSECSLPSAFVVGSVETEWCSYCRTHACIHVEPCSLLNVTCVGTISFFFFPLVEQKEFFFTWKIIDLQCFRYTAKWLTYINVSACVCVYV